MSQVDTALFRRDVYDIVASIPRGKVMTYGQIALLAGYPHHARLVGHVLHGSDPSWHLPCHRVVNAVGRTAPGWLEQSRLLLDEGVTLLRSGRVDMLRCQWRPEVTL